MSIPYQIAQQDATLVDALQGARLKGMQSSSETMVKQQELEDIFLEEVAEAQRKAESESKKGLDALKFFDIVAFFTNPLLSAATKTATTAIRTDKAKDAYKNLLDVNFDRWGKTFLGDESRAFKEEAEDAQLTSGDVFRAAAGAGLTSYTLSSILGGDAESGGLFRKMFTKNPVEVAGEQVVQSTAADGSIIKEIIPAQSVMKATPFKTLIGEFDKFIKRGTIKGNMGKIQSAVMLPVLLQQMLGDY